MVQGFAPASGGSHGDAQIVLDPVLPDELLEVVWAEAGVNGCILGAGLA
jgi:hypothetical protein